MMKKTVKENKRLIDRETFALRLKALRRESGLTQTELAEKIGSTRSCISNWENGSRFPEISYVQSMARVYGVPIDYLYGTCEHRYNINVPDYFELDLTKLNDLGINRMHEYYKLLLNSKEYTEKGL